MENLDFVAIHASSPYVCFEDLHLGRSFQEVVGRLLRFWDAKNIRKDGEFMGITTLFLDEKDSVIPGFIPSCTDDQFCPLLEAGLIYRLSGFEVFRSSKTYKVSEHPYVLWFLPTTIISKLQEAPPQIQEDKFMLRNFDQLQSLANTNMELPHVVGQIRFVQGSYLSNSTSTQRVVVKFMIAPYVTVNLTLWDDVAATFRAYLDSDSHHRSVMVVTTINPKLFGGDLYLNSTPGTRFYFDSNLNAIVDFKNIFGVHTNISYSRVDTTDSIAKMEEVTIRELCAYISKPNEQIQEADFIVKATITTVLGRKGWSYISCGSCSRKLEKCGSSFRCNRCATPAITGLPRYKVDLKVSDGDCTSIFVVFDTEMTKITTKTSSTLIQEVADNVDGELPQCLKNLKGKHYNFQLRVTPFNFTPSHQTFTVVKMTEMLAPPGVPHVPSPP